MNKIRICKGDRVMVITGREYGQVGTVSRVLRKKNALIIDKVNEVSRHMRKNPYTEQPGQIIKKNLPVPVSNVMLVCSSCGQLTRIGYRFVEKDGRKVKVRFCKRCNEVIG